MRFLTPLSWPLIALVQVILSLSSCADASSFRDHCLAFEPEALIWNSTRTRLEYVTAGTTLQLDDNVSSCNRPSQEVQRDLCRVALQIPTSKRSSISFELWLPRKWDGRFLATGNGGVDGCIKYEDLAYGTANGFATMGTNNGHNGTTGETFLNNPDIIEDFTYRALHTGSIAAKKLIHNFYDAPVEHSYFLGCSLGGRMGIKAAELFPSDYDGIVAGSPAVDFNHLQGQRAMFYTITGAEGSEDFISKETWTGLLHAEILKQCDGIDGVEDGIIEVPGRCFFDPTTLLCEDNQHEGCLSEKQTDQVRRIYAPYTYEDGSLIFPRMNPGNEEQAVEKLLSGQPFSYSVDWFRYVVLNDSTWDPATYDRDLVRLADQQNPFNIRTFPSALAEFKHRGGKLLSYHGGQDNQITSFNTERFWDHMAQSDPHLAEYYRFFRVSGMFHCSSGPGAWVLGQGGGAAAEGIGFEAESNVLAAIVSWVEKGKAPEVMRGTKFVGDEIGKGVDFHRDHCLYPKTQTYVGGGSKLPSSWECK